MATGTLIFRPDADISNGHSESSGAVGYSLLRDTVADDDSTYIYQTLSSTSSTTMTSVFTLGLEGSLPSSSIRITAARLYSRARKSSNGETASYTCYFAAGTSAGGSDANASTSGTLGSSYSTVSSTSSALMNTINSLIPTDFPVLSVKVVTTGTKSSSKNASNGYIRVTQIYLELDYEETGSVVPDIPTEDPTKTYHSVTISSINATTNPSNGTIRVLQGDNQTITINPTDPILTLALDNGVDITNQLVGGVVSNTYTVSTPSGASYGFNLNNNSYYESTNQGRANSAALARVNLNLETDCVVTFSYINYAEATYDYGIFGRIDTALSTSSTADSNPYLACSANSANTSNVQTLTYQVSAGNHFIDVKYRKDGYTDSYNDSLQFKVSIEAIGSAGTYTYTLNNINKKHSLMFIFGSVNYYFITATGNNDSRLFPDGQIVKLEGENYQLTIVPDDPNASVVLFDNGIDRSTLLTQSTATDKSGNTVTIYTYDLTNINTEHTLNVVCPTANTVKGYMKTNNTWRQFSKIYVKINGVWVEQSSLIWSALFDSSKNYKLD